MKGPIATAAGKPTSVETNGNGNDNSKNGDGGPVDVLTYPTHHIGVALEKKLRNLGKRTERLQQMKKKFNADELTAEQKDAVSKAGEVELQVEFVKEMQKQVKDQQRIYKKALREKNDADREKKHGDNVAFLKLVLKSEALLKLFDSDRNAFTTHFSTTQEETAALEKLTNKFSMTMNGFKSLQDWESQVDSVANIVRQIGNGKQNNKLEENLTGARFLQLTDKLAESNTFQMLAQFNCSAINDDPANNMNAADESDESSVNDFRQDTAETTTPECYQQQQDENEQTKPSGEVQTHVEAPVFTETEAATATKPEPVSEPANITSDANTVTDNSTTSNGIEKVEQENATVTTDSAHIASASDDNTATANNTKSVKPNVEGQPQGGNESKPVKDLTDSKQPNSRPPRRPYNNHNGNYHRNNRRVEQPRSGEQNNINGGGRSSRPSNSRPYNNYQRQPRNSDVGVQNKENGQNGYKAHSNDVQNEDGWIAARRTEPARRYNDPHNDNFGGGGNNGGDAIANNENGSRRPYVRNGGNRVGNGNGNGGGYAPRTNNYEKRAPRTQQPYELGFVFAKH